MDDCEGQKEVGHLLKEIRKELEEAIEKGKMAEIERNQLKSQKSNRLGNESNRSKSYSIKSSRKQPDIIETDTTDNTLKTLATSNLMFENISAQTPLDDDIKKMRVELKKSYDLFTTTRDTLDAISFEGIRSRIRDLDTFVSSSDMSRILEKGTVQENLDEMSKYMAGKFQKHPGEFADIPEISTFYRVCSQLETGLKNLTNQRDNFEELAKRIKYATTTSDDRTIEIQKILKAAENEVDNKKKLRILNEGTK